MHLVAIGGSDAGISAALRARELDLTAEVTVVVADAYPNFSICGIPYLISGEVTHWRNLAHRTHTELEATGMRLRLDTLATRIHPAAHQVHLRTADGGEEAMSYDALVVGTGTTVRVRWLRSTPSASMSAPIASDTRSPFRASSDIRACSPAGPSPAATRSAPTSPKVQADGVGFVVDPWAADVERRGMHDEGFLLGVTVEAVHGAQAPGDRRCRPALRLEPTARRSRCRCGAPRTGRDGAGRRTPRTGRGRGRRRRG
jgi:NADPH-dependent 2,4-dienoyl-CoA reductase/sulfur reductase-like enzyme